MDRGIPKRPTGTDSAGNGDLIAAVEVAGDDRPCMSAAVGNGEPPEPARSEPIYHPAKKQHHTERIGRTYCGSYSCILSARNVSACPAAFLPWQLNLFQGLLGRAPTLIIEVGLGYHIS
jgi:hypothetical protein